MIDESISELLFQIVDEQQYEEISLSLQGYPSPQCSSPIHSDEIIWKCYDCSKEQDVVCLCHTCFLQGDHVGHRVYFYQKSSNEAVCDCADTSQPYPFFCKIHKQNFEVNQQELVQKIKPNFMQNLTQFIRDQLIHIFKMMETGDENIIQDANTQLLQLIQTLRFLMKDKLPLIYLISNQIITTTNEILQHDCNYLDTDKINQEIKQSQLCTCTFVGNLFRYTYCYSQNLQIEVSDFLKVMLFNKEYKQVLTKEYCNMFNFLIYLQTEKSAMLSMYCQFFSTSSMIYIMNSQEYRVNCLQGLKLSILELQNNPIQHNNNMIEKWQRYYSVLHFQFSHPQCGEIWKPDNFELPLGYISVVGQSRNHIWQDINHENACLILDSFNMEIVFCIFDHIHTIQDQNLKLQLYEKLFTFISDEIT